jgi:hypothetical protein
MSDGVPLSRRSFGRLLRGLSRDELVAFVADLWALRGWVTAVEEGVVVADDGEQRRRLAVYRDRRFRPDDPPGVESVDAVVTTGGESDRAGRVAADLDADLVTAEDLYDAAMYAVDRRDAKALLWDHFGRVLEGGALGAASATAGSATRVAAAALGVALVVAVVAGAAGVFPGGGSPPAAGTTTAGGQTSVGAAGTTAPTATTLMTTAPPTTEIRTTFEQSAVGAFPTCERSPTAVTRAVVDAFGANNPEENLGLEAAWRFLAPETRTSFGSFTNFARVAYSDPYRALFAATNHSLGPPLRPENATAVQPVRIDTADGEAARFEFTLRRQSGGEYDGCWMVESLSPVTGDDGPDDPPDPTAVYPTCNRDAEEVSQVFLGALRADDVTRDRGFEAAWRFLTPGTGTGFRTVENFEEAMRNEAYDPLLNGTNVTYGSPEVSGERATQLVTATTANGSLHSYRMVLAHVFSLNLDGCWRVESLEPLSEDRLPAANATVAQAKVNRPKSSGR